MRAFVTGATGMLGSNLVRLLLEQGHAVTGLVRSKEKAAQVLGDVRLALIEGDMRDVAGFAPSLSDHDVLFHTAAFFREYYQPGEHWAQLKAVNIDATLELFTAAERHGVKKVIHVSSGGAIGTNPDGTPGDEHTPPDKISLDNRYFRSKVFGDQAIATLCETSTLPVVSILPGWMFGPGDAAPTNAGQFVLDHLNRRLPAVIDGGVDIVDARDVAAAMISAVEHGRSGERYIVGGRFTAIPALQTTLAQVSGVAAPRLQLPSWAALALAWVATTFARLTKQPSMIPYDGVQTLTVKKHLTSAKAVSELGAQFRPLEDTLRDTVNWYRAHQPEQVPAALVLQRA